MRLTFTLFLTALLFAFFTSASLAQTASSSAANSSSSAANSSSSAANYPSSAANYETQTITLALTQEPPQLNSMKATDQVSGLILGHVMEGLLTYDRRGKLIPGVAEKWEIDANSATFWLRKDAKWSDGKPVTADNFVFAWQTALKPETASEYSFILYSIENAEAVNQGKKSAESLSVTAIDDYTLNVKFEGPIGYFDKLTAFVTFFPVRRDFFEAKGDSYGADAKDLLYNGPFKMTAWTHSASMRMEKNEHYWDKDNIKLNAINADYITEDSRARLNLYIDGKIIHTRLDGETYKDALTQRQRIRSFTTGSVFYLEYNFRDGRVTRNKNLRKAIQHVFDPDELVNKVLATPGNLPGSSLFPVWLSGIKDKFRREYKATEPKIDIVLARQYLEKAKDELGVEKIPPLVLLAGNSPTSAKQAEYLQGVLKAKLDIDVKIDIQTFKQRLAKMTSGDFDIVAAGWGPDFDDIMTFGDLFASWNLNNRGRYNNPEYDRLVRIGKTNTDPKTRMDAMGEIQKILYDDAVIVPQYEQGVIYLMHPKVKGVVRRVIGADPDFRRAQVVK
ncbi:MAG: oligopeptide transport system substrate-binding protein [Candidatus Azotimanducaceae bacterium]|jgi:oligopeptide transport system substrate-binding protein